MNLSNVRVAPKLWATIVGLLLVMALSNLWVQQTAMRTLEHSRQDVQRFEQQIAAAETMRGKILRSIEMSIAMQATNEPRLQQAFEKRFQQLYALAVAALEDMKASLRTEQDRQSFAAVLQAFEVLKSSREQAVNTIDYDDYNARANFALGEYLNHAEVYGARIEDFIAVQRQQLQALMQAADGARDRASWLGWISTAVLLLLGMGLTHWLVRNINRPLQEAVALTEAIGRGNLTVQTQTARQDELGQLLNALSAMALRLRSVIGEVRQGVDAVSAAAGQMASGNQDLSARTEQTAANLQQTTASVEQMNASVVQAADASRQASQLAVTAVQAAERGGEVVAQVVQSMGHINASSRKISDIIGVINSIAFQTNILALNAAVEAARAGEQGRGFAVVAGEVRSLAQRSAEAAKEIKSLIEASVRNVDTGAAQVQQAGASMEEIVTSVRRVTDLIGEVTASANEQSQGFSLVNQAVGSLDQMTQQNAALVEESSAAAHAMHEQAQRLMQVVSVFEVGQPAFTAQRTATVEPTVTAAAVAATAPVRSASSVLQAPQRTAPAHVTAPKVVEAPQKAAPAQSHPAEDDWETF